MVFSASVDETLKEVCLEISKRYPIRFLEIGTDRDHVHLLVQTVPTYSATRVITVIKSITAREIFKRHPEVKNQLWGGEFWTDGYFVSSVSKHGNEATIARYVEEQGVAKDYKRLHRSSQLTLFDE